MTEALAAFEAEEEQRQQAVESPALEAEREDSQSRYADLAPSEAQQVLASEFGTVLEALDDDPVRFLSEAQLIRPLGADGALVMSEGRKMLIEGTVPVLNPDGGGKIDLTLESTGDGFEPVNPLVNLDIPDSPEEGVAVGDEGLEVSQAGAPTDSTARLLGEMDVFYPEVHEDTDLLVVPTAVGVELFDQLRSEDSPETLRFHVDMPAGAQLRSDANAAEIVDADGSKLATIPPPTAVDAQGTPVPVQMRTEGNSLVLDVKREPGEFAYPILVDPTFEEWYWKNWFEGHNTEALTSGAWQWNTSDGPSSSYVFGSTYCIYKCWGSGRGLYISTPSGYLPPNKWGQWSYSTPNAATYLSEAWVSPFWRDDHVNCSGGQPFDYVGMWNETGWNRILWNETTKNNNQGWAQMQSWGTALIIGMGTSSGVTIPCWRDIMAGGALIWLEDYSRPELTTSSTGQWMDGSPVRLSVSAYDAGLGVQKFKATAVNTTGATSEWWTSHSCTGLSQAPCPHTWNLGEGSQPQLNFSPSALPEGIDKLSVTAYDAAEKPSFTTNEMTVRIDHYGPTISLSGSLTEQASVGTELPFYTVAAVALDGDPKATQSEPGKIRSGVVKLEFEIDGQAVEPFIPKCAGEPNCGAEQEIGILASQMAPGQHTLRAKAKDAYGHLTVKELKFTVNADKTPPTLLADGLPNPLSFVDSLESVSGTNSQLNAPADIAVDSKGNVWVLDKGNNRIGQFNEKGEFIKAIGSFGSTAGKLNAPAGLAVDSGGNIWVADTGNNRIQQFNEKGEFVLAFGKDVNKTKVEAGGAEAERRVCAATSGNVCQAGVAGSAPGQLKAPRGIAVTSGGNIWVADTGNSRIQKFTSSGVLVNNISGEGSEPGKLKEPSSIAIGPDGSIWVADTGNNRIQQWSSSLAILRQFGSEGVGNGEFKRPSALDVDAAGVVWVGDQNNSRVQQFSEVGAFLGKFGAAGSNGGQFSFSAPFGLTVDAKANIWIADSGNNRVQEWSPSLVIGTGLEPVTMTATDQGFGTTQLVVKLTNEAGQTEVLDSVAQTCPHGACSMNGVFSVLDLSERPTGAYTLVAEAIDGAGNASRTSRGFTLSPDPPQLTLSGALAEADGEPLTTASGNLSIKATETTSASAGIREISVEVDHQQVASRTFNCIGGCQEVNASYRYSAKRDGAERSIEAAATPYFSVAKTLNAISCVTANDCMAVGYYKRVGGYYATLVERWNGTSWEVLTSPNPPESPESRLEGISCTSATSCIAVGYYQTGPETFSTLIMRWNGSNWSIVPSPNAAGTARNYLYGVSCSASNDCWAVGKSAYTAQEESEGKRSTPLVEHWNGSEWTIATVLFNPPSQLKAVSCVSATFCLAVSGTSDLAVARWNGSLWFRQTAANPTGGSNGTLNSISCISEATCTAVGHYTVNGHTAPLAERWSSTGLWSVQQAVDPKGVIEEVTGGSLNAVSCIGTAACTAVGTRSGAAETQPLVEGWDGTDWALQPAPIPSGTSTAALAGVACVGEFNCRSVGGKAGTNALIAKEVPDQGSKLVTVEAVDKYGNAASENIEVDVPEFTSETPECSQEVASVAPKAVVGAGEAANALQTALPGAVTPSEPAVSEENGEEIDPSYSEPTPNLDSVGTPIEGETEVTPEGGFTLKGIACFSPVTLTSAATEAKVLSGDAAIFANTAPETDTLLRPTAGGVAMVQSLRGPNAPTSISWNVTLTPDEKLVELPSGAVAITRAGSAGEAAGETVEMEEPEGMRSGAVLHDAQLQQETQAYQLVQANSETTEIVLAVIPQPWVILKEGSIMPLKIEVEQDVAVPTEYTMTYEYPEFEPNFTPEAVGGEAVASSSSADCPNGSPCGKFVVEKAVKYAKHWGKAERNPKYPNFHEKNCTNFLSQIMAHGGMRYMRPYEAPKEVGSWWVRPLPRSSDETLFEWADRWSVADEFPRHLWQYGLAEIDSSNQPSGWTAGNILAEDWYGEVKGEFDHVQFVSGTRTINGVREPLIANSSKPDDANYPEEPWVRVKRRIEDTHPEGWDRVPLVPKYRFAVYGEKGAKKHDPDNLYNSAGMFQG